MRQISLQKQYIKSKASNVEQSDVKRTTRAENATAQLGNPDSRQVPRPAQRKSLMSS
jgi:hypothetical protein